jgi:hypothetical protein
MEVPETCFRPASYSAAGMLQESGTAIAPKCSCTPRGESAV